MCPINPFRISARMHSKPVGKPGSRNTSFMSKDIAVHYCSHVSTCVILSQAWCQTVTAYIFCTVLYCMVWCLACKLWTASAGWHVEKVTYVHHLVHKYKYFNRITAVTTETVPAWQLAARNLVHTKNRSWLKSLAGSPYFFRKWGAAINSILVAADKETELQISKGHCRVLQPINTGLGEPYACEYILGYFKFKTPSILVSNWK